MLLVFVALTAALTYPLAFRLGSVAYRPDNGDGQFSVWNTSWVARALVLNPRHVFDANIFYPEAGTLAYSEANIGSGALAVPVYWWTANPFAAHGFVVLLSFIFSATGAYALVRHLTGDRVAALSAGVIFGFCPHVYAHLLHIQLLWTAGLPWSLVAFHRLVDHPSWRRGVVLGLAMAWQLYLCAYYAVFLVLTVGVFALAVATLRQRWTSPRYWLAMTVAGAVALAASAPLLNAYLQFQQTTGFARPLSASGGFSANWQAYLASPAYAHSWILPWLGSWNEVLFPGWVGAFFAGLALLSRLSIQGRPREARVLYLTIGLLAHWASFGPAAGLYQALYEAFPPFSFMRAPSRFGVIVTLVTAVLAGLGIAHARTTFLRSPWATAALIVLVVAEHVVPLDFRPVPPVEPGYRKLATLPYGALIEMPVYSERAQFVRARYMLASTTHWMPIVNAYSDYIPARFQENLQVLGDFPSHESLRLLTEDGVRYAMFHLDSYGTLRGELDRRLAEFAPQLALRYEDPAMRLYEIIPPSRAHANAAPPVGSSSPTSDDRVVE